MIAWLDASLRARLAFATSVVIALPIGLALVPDGDALRVDRAASGASTGNPV